MQSIFLFALAYVCLQYPTETLETQMERLNQVRMDAISSTAALSDAHQFADASYSLGITGLLAAVDNSGLKSLEYVGDAIGNRPMSARFGYAFAIIHRHCRNHEAADECAISVSRSIESPRANLFFRRSVARAYERRGNLNSALSMFDEELQIWGLWTAHLDRLLIRIFVEQQDLEGVVALWKKLNSQYSANESNLMATLVVAAGQRTMNWDMVGLWDSVASHTINMDAQRIARGKLNEANTNSVLNQQTLVPMENQLYKLDNSTRRLYTGIELHGKMLFPLLRHFRIKKMMTGSRRYHMQSPIARSVRLLQL
jgi:hypothetical protein